MDLRNYLPDYYNGVYEFETLMHVENDLLGALSDNIERSRANLYVATADSDTLSIYETMLKLPPTPNASLSARRFRILARLTGQKPYTLRYLAEMVAAFGSPVNLSLDYNAYTLNLATQFDKEGQAEELDYLLRVTVPANILLNVKNALNIATKSGEFLASRTVTHDVVTLTGDKVQDVPAKGSEFLAGSMVSHDVVTLTSDIKQEISKTATQYHAQRVIINAVYSTNN